MKHLARSVRRIHPLFHLYRSPIVREAIRRLDRPAWVHVEGIPWAVRMRAIRNISYRFEPQDRHILGLLETVLTRTNPRSLWDVGAYVGFYSWYVKSHAASTEEVHLFEPDPENADLLRATIASSGHDCFHLHEVAASNICGTVEFEVDEVTHATGSVAGSYPTTFAERHFGLEPRTRSVQCVRLETVQSRLPPDLIKVDVEGNELAALEGAESILRDHQPVILFESLYHQAPVVTYLSSLGYQVRDVGNGADSLAVPRRFQTLIQI